MAPSETIPDSRPKWAKCTPVFRPKRPQNPTLWGGTYPYSLYKGVIFPRPPPAGTGCNTGYLWHWWKIAFWLLRCLWKYVTQSFEEFWQDFYTSRHGGSIWSDMSVEILWMPVTCISYHVNINQHWIKHWQSFLFSSGYISDVFTK